MEAKGGFPLSRNFSEHTQVIFTRIHKIEAKYSKSREHVKAERHSAFTFKAIPFFSFSVEAFPDIGSVGRIEKKNFKTSHKKSRS